jgi:PBP1b-binding outer membrane lipoprotein LpoB
VKKYIYIFLAVIGFLFASCSSNKSIPKTSEDKALLSIIKKLDKDPSNSELQKRISSLYNEAAKSHLDKIEVYNTLTEPDRWVKIVKQFEALKKLSEVIANSATAAKLINASSYISELQTAKQNGAEAFYAIGMADVNNTDKQSARNAYYAFKKTDEFVPGYKDVKEQIKTAYQNSIVRVVVNPVRDNTYFYNSMGWNNYGNNYNNDYFQRSLVRDLGGNYNNNSLGVFYTDWDARRENIRPDWEVDLTWMYLDIPQPMSNQYSRNVSRQIEVSRDTSGKVQYQTVTATLYVTRKYFTASGDMEMRITDVNTGRNITTQRYNDQFNWQEEYATYTGDSRALSGNEYALLTNNNYQIPRKEDILAQLSQRIYPQVKNRIATVVNW